MQLPFVISFDKRTTLHNTTQQNTISHHANLRHNPHVNLVLNLACNPRCSLPVAPPYQLVNPACSRAYVPPFALPLRLLLRPHRQDNHQCNLVASLRNNLIKYLLNNPRINRQSNQVRNLRKFLRNSPACSRQNSPFVALPTSRQVNQ